MEALPANGVNVQRVKTKNHVFAIMNLRINAAPYSMHKNIAHNYIIICNFGWNNGFQEMFSYFTIKS